MMSKAQSKMSREPSGKSFGGGPTPMYPISKVTSTTGTTLSPGMSTDLKPLGPGAGRPSKSTATSSSMRGSVTASGRLVPPSSDLSFTQGQIGTTTRQHPSSSRQTSVQRVVFIFRGF